MIDRRSFLGRLAVAIGVIKVAPTVITESPKLPDSDPYDEYVKDSARSYYEEPGRVYKLKAYGKIHTGDLLRFRSDGRVDAPKGLIYTPAFVALENRKPGSKYILARDFSGSYRDWNVQ